MIIVKSLDVQRLVSLASCYFDYFSFVIKCEQLITDHGERSKISYFFAVENDGFRPDVLETSKV